MEILLAPVYESFLAVRTQCLKEGGFVVGPMGMTTAENLFKTVMEIGIRDKSEPCRFSFDPLLAGAVYESHPKTGTGAFRYIGLIDEIEFNNDHHTYRFLKMKPGEGQHGEQKYDERMAAFVRFKVLQPVCDVLPGCIQLWPRDFGLKDGILRFFKFGNIRKTALREAFEQMQAAAKSK